MSYNKRLIFLFLISLCAILGVSKAQAQDASLQGIITDYATGQPLYGANAALRPLTGEGETLGAAADGNGFYRVGSIRPGRYALRISYIGYRPYQDTLQFQARENRTVNVALEPGAQMDEVVVEQSKGAAWKEEGRQRITPVELSRVPSPAAGDLATYLQTLPGVVSMGDRGGQVYIRGGTPTQNLVLMDGAMVYRPTHIVGFFSPFPENLVSGVDFYAGGFGPRYNSRISSVMDIQMRYGNRFNTSGSASISPFAGEIMAEGPILEGESSWMFSMRNSLIEQTSGGWYPVDKQPLKFGSQLFKASLIDDASRCSALLMNTYDRGQMDFDIDDTIKWRNFVLGGRCVALPENSRTLMDTNVNLSYFSNSRIDTESSGFSSNIWRINLDLNLRQYAGEVRFDYGIFGRMKRLGYNMDEEFLGLNNDNFTQFILGGYLETSLPVGQHFKVRPGTALTFYPGDFPISLEPRIRFSWQPFGSESQELMGAAGFYRQSVVGINDMRDASSVFVAWMNAPIDDAQMEALHTMLGWQQVLADGLTWSLEGYYKRLRNQPVPLWSTIARFTTELALANGDVYGGDLRLEYNRGIFYGMLGYGYSWTRYEAAQEHFNMWFGEPVQEYYPPHDRRHQLNALFSLDIGKYTAGFRWQLGTGVPYTRPMGFDDLLDFRDRLPDVKRDQGLRRVILDKPYQGRLPTTHRLDVSLERSFRIAGPGVRLNARAGAVNLYNQRNMFFYDVYTHRRIDQLPLVPYLTLKLEIGKGKG